MKKSLITAAALILGICSAMSIITPVHAQGQTVFGPEECTIVKHNTHFSHHEFRVDDPGKGIIIITKETPDKEIRKGHILFNGKMISLREFLGGEEAVFLQDDLALRTKNHIMVFLQGTKGASITIEIWRAEGLIPQAVPHFVYGKVFTSDGKPPLEEDVSVYAYLPVIGDEILDRVSGCGYQKIGQDGWLWCELGTFSNPWYVGDDLRVFIINERLQETGAVDITLDDSGHQVFDDLVLQYGDTIGPIASDTVVRRYKHHHWKKRWFRLTATVDDTLAGNNDIQTAEYYIDTDPGLGLGREMKAWDRRFDEPTEDVWAWVDVSAWEAGSDHTIYVRGKDAADNWGASQGVVVSVGLPPAECTPGGATGGGFIKKGDYKCPLHLRVYCEEGAGRIEGKLIFIDRELKWIVRSTYIRSFTIAGDTVTIRGDCRVNKASGYTFICEVKDGSPDRVSLEVKDAGGAVYYTVSGTMACGDIKIEIDDDHSPEGEGHE